MRRDKRAPLLAGDGPLARVPPVVAFLVVAGLFATAIIVRGLIGAALLGVLAVAVGILLAATWPMLAPPARAGRVVVLVILVTVAVSLVLTR